MIQEQEELSKKISKDEEAKTQSAKLGSMFGRCEVRSTISSLLPS